MKSEKLLKEIEKLPTWEIVCLMGDVACVLNSRPGRITTIENKIEINVGSEICGTHSKGRFQEIPSPIARVIIDMCFNKNTLIALEERGMGSSSANEIAYDWEKQEHKLKV